MNSWEELYENYSGAVFAYLHRLSGDRHLAEDLASETFTRAMLALDGFRGEASLKTWLLRIARNLYIRRTKRESRLASLEELTERGVAVANGHSDPEAAVIRDEEGLALRRALRSLSEADRSILLLAAQENLRCREIADVFGISLTAVKVRLFRARRRLIAALEGEGTSPSSPDRKGRRPANSDRASETHGMDFTTREDTDVEL